MQISEKRIIVLIGLPWEADNKSCTNWLKLETNTLVHIVDIQWWAGVRWVGTSRVG